LKYKEYLLFNKNILIGFVCAFITGATVSQLILAKFTYASNSLVTLITEDVVFYTIFGILFYIDYKRSYIKQEQQSIRDTRFGDIKWIIVKLISTMSIAEIEYNIVKPYIQYWFLTQLFEPFIASVVGSLAGIVGFIVVADLIAYSTRLFKKR
jgi:hypothetical protein